MIILNKGSDFIFCQNCNAEISDNSCFCENCGAKIGQKVQQKQCLNCGEYIDADAKFCGFCGFNFESESDNYAHCPACGAVINPNDEFCGECGYNISAKDKKPDEGKKKTVFIALIAVLSSVTLVIGSAIVGYLCLKPEDKEESDNYTLNNMVNNTQENSNASTPLPTVTASTPMPTQSTAQNSYSYDNNSDYLFPSDTVYITEKDLMNKSKDEVALIRNEIYARHGYIFKTEPYKSYFESKNWYIPTIQSEAFDYSSFNAIEKANIDAIREYESRMGW